MAHWPERFDPISEFDVSDYKTYIKPFISNIPPDSKKMVLKDVKKMVLMKSRKSGQEWWICQSNLNTLASQLREYINEWAFSSGCPPTDDMDRDTILDAIYRAVMQDEDYMILNHTTLIPIELNPYDSTYPMSEPPKIMQFKVPLDQLLYWIDRTAFVSKTNRRDVLTTFLTICKRYWKTEEEMMEWNQNKFEIARTMAGVQTSTTLSFDNIETAMRLQRDLLERTAREAVLKELQDKTAEAGRLEMLEEVREVEEAGLFSSKNTSKDVSEKNKNLKRAIDL